MKRGDDQRGGDQREAPEIGRSSVVVASQEQVSAELTADFSGQAVVLDLKGGVYYELNEVGARVWRLIQEPRSVQSVLDSLLSAYEVPEEQCEADLTALLDEMLARGLIEIRDG